MTPGLAFAVSLEKGGAHMNVVALPVQRTPQTQRPVILLETIPRSSACGHQNPPEAAFCGECGTLLSPQQTPCATCGQPTPARLTFCRNCGTEQSAPARMLALRSLLIAPR